MYQSEDEKDVPNIFWYSTFSRKFHRKYWLYNYYRCWEFIACRHFDSRIQEREENNKYHHFPRKRFINLNWWLFLTFGIDSHSGNDGNTTQYLTTKWWKRKWNNHTTYQNRPKSSYFCNKSVENSSKTLYFWNDKRTKVFWYSQFTRKT